MQCRPGRGARGGGAAAFWHRPKSTEGENPLGSGEVGLHQSQRRKILGMTAQEVGNERSKFVTRQSSVASGVIGRRYKLTGAQAALPMGEAACAPVSLY